MCEKKPYRGFCERVHVLRRQYKLSVEQLSMLIGIEPEYLYQMEEGILSPEVDAYHLLRLTEVFHVSSEELLKGTTAKQK